MFTLLGMATFGLIAVIVVLWLLSKKKRGGMAGRLFNLGKGKADRAIEDLEKQDPEALLRAAIDECESDVEELDGVLRELTGFEFREKESIENTKRAIKDLQPYIDGAIEQDDEELGAELLTKQEALEEEITDHEKQAEFYKKEAESTRKLLDSRKQELDELKREVKNAKNITKTADVVTRLQQRRDGIATDSTSKSLETAREAIAASKASLAANREIESNSLESRMERLKEKGSKSAAAAKFAELKKARENKDN